jgi:hypothetical protein
MMAQNANITTGPLAETGETVTVPRLEMPITIDYIDDAGVAQKHVGTIRYPDLVMNGITPAMIDILVQLYVDGLNL